jgi:predicted choloylglycine hydrolase
MLLSCVSDPRIFEFSMPDTIALLTQGQVRPSVQFLPYDFGVDYIRSAELTGSHEALGRLIGEVSKGTVIHPRRVTSAARELNLRIIEMYRGLYPPYLDELAGIASVYGMQVEDLDLRYMEREFFVDLGWLGFAIATAERNAIQDLGQHCSVLAYRLPDGTVEVGRNFDFVQRQGFIVRNTMDGDIASIGNGYICLSQWVMDGINSSGLTVAVMSVIDPVRDKYAHLPYPDSPAVDCHHLMRIILNTCATYREAVDLAGSVRVWFGNENVHFLVADSSGGMGIFEFDSQGSLHVQGPEAGEPFLLSTNSWLTDTPMISRLRCWRYATARYTLEKTEVHDVHDLFPIVFGMALHPSNPLALGLYGTSPDEETLRHRPTIWTSFFDLSARTMNVRFWEDREQRWFEFTPASAEPRSARTSL